ncbi:MAG TPA: protein kinase, partial [Bacillota bacterium]|nr:protein kinase [Bacillota bacterium]
MTGELLGGRYSILDTIGEGGMATVYRARDGFLQRTVAIKVLRPQYASDAEFRERFRREAQSAAALSHPNIVNVYDVGRED